MITLFNQQFSLKYLGHLSYFIRIEVTQLAYSDLHLSEQKYIKYLLQKEKIENYKPIASSMTISITLFTYYGTTFESPSLYKSIIRAI